MASVEFLEKRVAGKKAEIDKLNKKLDRIKKAKSTNWEVNPYYYSERDLTITEKELKVAENALVDYEQKLKAEVEKSQSRDVKVILDFLESWKSRVKSYYIESLPKFLEARKEYYQLDSEYCDWFNHNFRERHSEEAKQRRDALHEAEKLYRSTWSFITPYIVDRDQLDMNKLQKDLDQEANRKYDFIIERTNEIVGQITDASQLTIGNKDDLNGFIHGTRGTAKVQTIGAGGYNIQCYHFRTLINKA